MSQAPRIHATSRSHEGRVRTNNEDSYCDRTADRMWAVADGMGGHEYGERASAAIVEALHAATLGGARALGFGDRDGSIEPGKQADLVCVDLSKLETQPLHHVVSQLIYASGRQQVSDVWIAGRRKLDRRELVDIDTAALIANACQWRGRIATIRTQ